jgi:hypothetical protein
VIEIWLGLSGFVALSLAFAYWITRPNRPNKSRLPGPAVKMFELDLERDNTATVRLSDITTVRMSGGQKRAMRRRSRES